MKYNEIFVKSVVDRSVGSKKRRSSEAPSNSAQ